jgi:phage replication initiation protein
VQSALADWFEFTSPENLPLSDLIPNSDKLDWLDLPYGRYGYKKGQMSGHITVYSAGHSPGMGIHVVMTGEGCRELEANGLTDWQGYTAYLLSLGCHFSRLDVAFDDRCGVLDMVVIRRAVEGVSFTSRWRSVEVHTKSSVKKGASRAVVGSSSFPEDRGLPGCTVSSAGTKSLVQSGNTIYFGSKKSDAQLRIYDKGLEQGVQDHWVRVELELRNERAQLVAQEYSKPEADMVCVLVGVLRSYLDFKEPGTSNQMTRWQTVDWWLSFCSGLEKVKLSIQPIKRTMASVIQWVRHQVAPSLALIAANVGGDLDAFADQIIEFSREGKQRWGFKHQAILAGG